MSAKYPTDRPFVHEPRTDRRPKDASRKFHDAADKWFFERFGVRYRSQGVFVTARRFTAQAHGASPAHLMRIVPLTAYRYCWSSNVADLLFKARELADADEDSVRGFLDSAGYQESSLEDAHAAGHEVMLHCGRFVAIPSGLLPAANESPASGILLPFAS
jgi:hypothetical protein